MGRSTTCAPTPASLRRALLRRRGAPFQGAEWAMKRGGWSKNAVVWATRRRYNGLGLLLRELSRQAAVLMRVQPPRDGDRKSHVVGPIVEFF